MRGQTNAVGVAAAMVMLAGLAVSSASAGVESMVWVEVDNSVGTVGATAGEPTGLEGVRTFDLYAVVTPDTRVWVADFGYVGVHQGYDNNMWTTQAVYQHPNGGDLQSNMIGVLSSLVALEFDTYVGMGMLDSQVVMNTAILGANWSPALFEAAWYGTQYTADAWLPAVGDAAGRLFLARISVSSAGGFGDPTGDSEWLGGTVFISGEDDLGEFGQAIPATGLFEVGNAFPTAPVAAVSGGGDGGADASDSDTPESSVPWGDLNGDGALDSLDVLAMQQVYGSDDSSADLNEDGIVSDLDVVILLKWIENAAANPAPGGVDLSNLSPKERKKIEKQRRQAEKRRLRAERKAAKQAEKERKKLDRQRRKEEKRREKERKKRARHGG